MSAAHSDLDAVLARIDADLDQSLERLDALLRIPSISTEATYREDCRRAAETIRADLAGLGFDAALLAVAAGFALVSHKVDRFAAPRRARRVATEPAPQMGRA